MTTEQNAAGGAIGETATLPRKCVSPLIEAIEQYLRRQRGHTDEDWYRALQAMVAILNVSARGDWDVIEITLRHHGQER
jgi:hypothetical protein